MSLANWVSVAGNLIEVGGFAYLSLELVRTNTSAIVENDELRAQQTDLTTLIVWEDDDRTSGGITLQGGRLGQLIDNINKRQSELSESKKLIRRGLIWTGFGIAVQCFGSLGQALYP